MTQNLGWNLYGIGIENVGKDGKPELFEIPTPNDNQMLVRVDSVGMCFSDVKLLRLGGGHAKLYGRDLSKEPTRLGHETAVTILQVGKNLQDTYQEGQRLAIQPDAYQNGKSTAYGYTIPGGLIQYHLIGKELLETDAGACVLPLEDGMGYAESALLEPWGCVMAAYTQRRRLTPKEGGKMWIIVEDDRNYQFSQFLDRPASVVISGSNQSVSDLLETASLTPTHQEYASVTGEFDDIVVLGVLSSEKISEIAKKIARRGTMNMLNSEPLDGLVSSDVGRLHYDYIAFIGNDGTDIADSYGEARNRCDLHPHGAAVFIGAGGPMGQMHVQRAIEQTDGPKLIIATDIVQNRLDALNERFVPLAKKHGRKLLVVNPTDIDESMYDYVMRETDGLGADDVVVSVPHAGLMAESATYMNANGMLNLFAGVKNGTMADLDLSIVYLGNAQYTGTSGLTIHDQADVMKMAVAGELSTNHSVAAIGGMNAAQEGIKAMMESRYPGKIVIFPQLIDLPLMGLDKIADHLPEVAKHLGENNAWTEEAEKVLLNL